MKILLLTLVVTVAVALPSVYGMPTLTSAVPDGGSTLLLLGSALGLLGFMNWRRNK